jgi:hypothetical protein
MSTGGSQNAFQRLTVPTIGAFRQAVENRYGVKLTDDVVWKAWTACKGDRTEFVLRLADFSQQHRAQFLAELNDFEQFIDNWHG